MDSENQKKFACDSCEFISNRSSALADHKNYIHLKLRPYKCDLCEFGSNRSGTLAEHRNGVHLKLRPYKCPKCDYDTAYSQSFAKHKRKTHVKCPGMWFNWLLFAPKSIPENPPQLHNILYRVAKHLTDYVLIFVILWPVQSVELHTLKSLV